MGQKISVFCDGGARGNPGPAGAGVVIIAGSREKRYKKYLGEKTNNQAEYEAVLLGLKIMAQKYPAARETDFYLDSELVVKQLNGEYKIKNQKLGHLLIRIHNQIISSNLKVVFKHIPRARNHQADKLVNEAIDGGI